MDQDNQGNTLVSVAPLSQPTETPEKPSVNGESPEAVKTEPAPPTNGHSTTNTADTEMWNSSHSTPTKLAFSLPLSFSPSLSRLPHWHIFIHTLSYTHTHRCLVKAPPPFESFTGSTAQWTSGTENSPASFSCCHGPRSSSFGYKYQENSCEGQWWMTAVTGTQSLGCWWPSGWERGAQGATVLGGKWEYFSINQLWLPSWLQSLEKQPYAVITEERLSVPSGGLQPPPITLPVNSQTHKSHLTLWSYDRRGNQFTNSSLKFDWRNVIWSWYVWLIIDHLVCVCVRACFYACICTVHGL